MRSNSKLCAPKEWLIDACYVLAEQLMDSSNIVCNTPSDVMGSENHASIDSATKPLEDRKTAVFLYTACTVASFFGGFKLHLLRNRKRYNPPEVVTEGNHAEPIESPKRFARRALFWGTVLSVVGTGTLCLASYYYYKA